MNQLKIINEFRIVKNGRTRIYYNCVCSCGKKVVVDKYKFGINTNSCGCLRKKLRTEKNITHGLSKTRLYKIYHDMKARCYNINNDDYKYYGAKNVKICDDWLNDFVKFHDWANDNGYKDNLTIDRIKPDGDYKPSNCQFITINKQQEKRRDCNFIKYNNKLYTMRELSKVVNINYNTLRAKYNLLNHNYNEFMKYINCKISINNEYNKMGD
jgi:hypothetical protein